MRFITMFLTIRSDFTDYFQNVKFFTSTGFIMDFAGFFNAKVLFSLFMPNLFYESTSSWFFLFFLIQIFVLTSLVEFCIPLMFNASIFA